MNGVNSGCLGNSRDVRHELSTSCIDHSAAFVGKIVCLEISEFEALGLSKDTSKLNFRIRKYGVKFVKFPFEQIIQWKKPNH